MASLRQEQPDSAPSLHRGKGKRVGTEARSSGHGGPPAGKVVGMEGQVGLGGGYGDVPHFPGWPQVQEMRFGHLSCNGHRGCFASPVQEHRRGEGTRLHRAGQVLPAYSGADVGGEVFVQAQSVGGDVPLTDGHPFGAQVAQSRSDQKQDNYGGYHGEMRQSLGQDTDQEAGEDRLHGEEAPGELSQRQQGQVLPKGTRERGDAQGSEEEQGQSEGPLRGDSPPPDPVTDQGQRTQSGQQDLRQPHAEGGAILADGVVEEPLALDEVHAPKVAGEVEVAGSHLLQLDQVSFQKRWQPEPTAQPQAQQSTGQPRQQEPPPADFR